LPSSPLVQTIISRFRCSILFDEPNTERILYFFLLRLKYFLQSERRHSKDTSNFLQDLLLCNNSFFFFIKLSILSVNAVVWNQYSSCNILHAASSSLSI
jgi:hypothetical protein